MTILMKAFVALIELLNLIADSRRLWLGSSYKLSSGSRWLTYGAFRQKDLEVGRIVDHIAHVVTMLFDDMFRE